MTEEKTREKETRSRCVCQTEMVTEEKIDGGRCVCA